MHRSIRGAVRTFNWKTSKIGVLAACRPCGYLVAFAPEEICLLAHVTGLILTPKGA
jgi:hypothetical protein